MRGWQFVSHKLLRWLSLFPMTMMMCSAVVLARGSVFFEAVLTLQGIFYALAAFGLVMAVARRSTTRLLAVPFYVVLGVVGAFVGIGESLLGRRFDIWEIPTLSRGSAEVTIPTPSGGN
jgi:hypothetical protein